MLSTILTLATLASAGLAAPAPVARASSDPPSGCTSLGKGPLGFDPTAIGIYSNTPPARYLGLWGNVDEAGHKVLQPGSTVPQEFELFSCKKTPSPSSGKGSIDAYQGYIVSTAAPGDCLSVNELGKFNAHFAAKPCDFSSGGIAADQHFQFQTNTFYSYYLIDFLGSTEGPTANATSSFKSGQGNYHYRIDTDETYGSDHIAADYQSGTYVSEADQIIAQVGSQYKAPEVTFPACRLRKQGSMSYTAPGGAAQTVTVAGTPIVNGNGTYSAFQFLECDSDAMGYVSDASAGIFYGHFRIASEDAGVCYVQQNGQGGPGNGLMFERSIGIGGGACGTSDSSAQAASFFKYDANTGHINFLGGAKSSNPGPIGWTIADNHLNLLPDSTDGIFAFDK